MTKTRDEESAFDMVQRVVKPVKIIAEMMRVGDTDQAQLHELAKLFLAMLLDLGEGVSQSLLDSDSSVETREKLVLEIAQIVYSLREPVTVELPDDSDEVFDYNITHNLNKMASEAGIYQHLWRPEELSITKASELIEPLTTGLALLESDPARFEALNPENGWGDYAGLVRFVQAYLIACKEYPEAEIYVSR